MPRTSAEILVVAGEASGDAMAAPVVSRLGVPAFGVGGPALRATGMRILSDTCDVAALGVRSVLARAPAIAAAAMRILAEQRRRRPAAALLVGYSEFNTWLGPRLRARGTRVLFYGAPQVWAWRAGRAQVVRRACDRMAVILPFEQALWRRHGVDAHYVGHPSLERTRGDRDELRARFGMTPYAELVAILPGSRAQEIARHLDPMLEAFHVLRRERGALDARVILSPALPAAAAERASRRALSAGVGVLEIAAPAVLPAFDVALAASGTVTLECAVAGVPPVIVYRLPRLTELLARRLIDVPHVGLPNLILGERAFTELLQGDAQPDLIADDAARLLDDRDRALARCAQVRDALQAALAGDGTLLPSARTARLLEPWLE